jgi:hypothetical protein
MDIEAPVEIPLQLGLKVAHDGIELEIEDLCPKTRRGKIKLAKSILAYNRAVRKRAKEQGVAFGDENTPYHLWDINWKKVLGG